MKQIQIPGSVRKDYDNMSNLLKRLRDEMFPLLDQVIDPSQIKSIDDPYKLGGDITYNLLSLVYFIGGLP